MAKQTGKKEKKPTTDNQMPISEREVIRSIIRAELADQEGFSPPDVLHSIVSKTMQPGVELAWFSAYDLDPNISQTAAMLLFSGMRDPLVPEHVQISLKNDSQLILLDALHDSKVPDDRKLTLGSLYNLSGGEISDVDYQACFEDFQGAMEHLASAATAHLSDQPQAIEENLSALEFINEEDSLDDFDEDRLEAMVNSHMSLVDKAPDAIGAIICTIAAIATSKGVVHPILTEALEVITEFPSDRIAWHLDELSRWPCLGSLGDVVDRMSQKVQAEGCSPKYTMVSDFSHGYFSMVDGAGSRNITLFFRTPEGGMDALIMILNDQVGIKDAWVAYGDSSEIEEAIHSQSEEIAYSPCTLELARELIGAAWLLHQQQKRPFPGMFFIYRPYLGSDPIEPCKRTPNLGAYMMETMVQSADLVQDSCELIDYTPYSSLSISSDAAYEFVKENAPKRGAGKLSKKNMERFIKEIVPQDMGMILSRMASNLEVECIAGRATQRLNQTAAKVWLALTENLCQPSDVDYICDIAKDSADFIIQNVRDGYNTQEEANQAALEYDDTMSSIFDEMGLGWDDDLDDEDFDDDTPF